MCVLFFLIFVNLLCFERTYRHSGFYQNFFWIYLRYHYYFKPTSSEQQAAMPSLLCIKLAKNKAICKKKRRKKGYCIYIFQLARQTIGIVCDSNFHIDDKLPRRFLDTHYIHVEQHFARFYVFSFFEETTSLGITNKFSRYI